MTIDGACRQHNSPPGPPRSEATAPRHRLVAALALVLAATPAQAGDGGTAHIRQAATALRQNCRLADWSAPRAALWQRLERWLDGELAKAEPDITAIERRLAEARIAADGGCAQFPGETDQFGQVSLSLRRVGQVLEARAAIGLTCGQDQRATLYRHDGTGWRRFWRGTAGTPMTIAALEVAADAPGGPLVLELARGDGCASSWRPIRTRLWRAAPGGSQRLLLERTDFAFLGKTDGPLAARLDGADAYVEFMTASLDVSVPARPALRHYRVEGERVRRLDPIALDPADFVEEWLGAAWADGAAWSEPAFRDAAKGWHAALRGRNGAPSLSGEFTGPPLRCRRDANPWPGLWPDLWQVGMTFADAPPRARAVWFLVRWTDPYRFRLAAIRHRPWPDCTEDADPSGRQRRLLPIAGPDGPIQP